MDSNSVIDQFYIDYIKAIENPNKIGWNGKIWTAPTLKGYDQNQRGYGIDINKNIAAKKLTEGRSGKWLSEKEANDLMLQHIKYVYNAAQKHIQGFNNLSTKRKAALLGMLYRGDSVNANKDTINIMEPDDNKFFSSISSYYKTKGLNERAKNSDNFFLHNKQPNYWNTIPQWSPSMQFKQGGKMNIIDFLKKGSGIHIKKENRGKFTDYCGGKVTSECIAKGKSSSNPTIRKRATFAANARKWKHEKGGELIKKAQEGTKLNFGQKMGNFIKSDFGKSAMSMGLNLLSNKLFNQGVSSESEIAKSQVDSEQANEEQQAVALAQAQTKQALANLENPDNPNANGGDIVKSNLYQKFLSQNLIPIQQKSQAKKAQIDMQTQQFKNQKSQEQFGQFVNTGLDLVNTALNHKKV